MISQRSELNCCKRIVLKIGSALLTDEHSGLRLDRIEALAALVESLRGQGIEVVIVTSGAVALGRVRLGWLGRKLTIHEKQAAAAVGQPMLMRAYDQSFQTFNCPVAQMLLTRDDINNRSRYLNASHTSLTLFEAGVVPIVNENDTVMIEEIKFGDNDTLAALVALLVNADLLVILTDVDGLFDKNPAVHADAKRISEVRHLSAEHQEMAGGSGSQFGTGGMASKVRAARIATQGGVMTAIVNGSAPEIVSKLLAGDEIGTLFWCGADRVSRRKHWIGDALKPKGRIVVDGGAAKALCHHGKSLLPVGVTEVNGQFGRGDCVEVVGPDGRTLARGLTNYALGEISEIAGHPSHEIESILGYGDYLEVIHRDNLVLLERGGA